MPSRSIRVRSPEVHRTRAAKNERLSPSYDSVVSRIARSVAPGKLSSIARLMACSTEFVKQDPPALAQPAEFRDVDAEFEMR